MTRTRVPLTALALVVLIALPSRAADQEQVIRVEPSRFETSVPPRWGVPELRWELTDLADAEEAAREDYVEALADILRDEVEEAGGDVITVEGGVQVAGAAALELARQRIGEIDRFVQGRATLRVAVVHVRTGEEVRDAAALRGLVDLRTADVLWGARLPLRRGEPVVRGETDGTTLVAGIDAEVANGASISDPRTAYLETGLRVAVCQRPIDARRTRAFLSLQLSRLDGVEQIGLGSGTLDLPRVSFASIGAPMVLTLGDPAFVTFAHPWDEGTVVTMVEAVELPAEPDLPFRLVDAAAVAGVDVAAPFVLLGTDDGSRWEDDAGEPYEAAVALADLLAARHPDAEPLTTNIVAVPRDAEIPAPPATAILDRRTWSVTSDTLASIEGYDPLGGTVPHASAAPALTTAPPVHRVTMPVAAGASAWFAGGVWTRVPAGVEVEIADTAVATYPVVVEYVAGDAFRAAGPDDGSVRISWESVRTLGRESRPLVVRKDLDGKRVDESEDVHVAVRHRLARGTDVVEDGGDPPLSVRRLPDRVEMTRIVLTR